MVLWDRFYMTGCQGALPNHYSSTYNSDIHLKSYNSWLIVIIFNYQKWSFIIHLYQLGGHPAFIHLLTTRIFVAKVAFWSGWNVLDWIRASFGVAAPRFLIRTEHYCCGCHRPFAFVVLLWVSTLSHLSGSIWGPLNICFRVFALSFNPLSPGRENVHSFKKVWQSHFSLFLF